MKVAVGLHTACPGPEGHNGALEADESNARAEIEAVAGTAPVVGFDILEVVVEALVEHRSAVLGAEPDCNKRLPIDSVAEGALVVHHSLVAIDSPG